MKTLTAIVLSLLLSACVTHEAGGLQFARNHPDRGSVKQSSVTHNGDPYAPALIRIIKETHELELWRRGTFGWSKVKTYNICTFSGDIGPKKRSGDRQAPEGFYNITRYNLNPFSREYLSIDTGFPNARDRAHGYTGSALMIHGACSSIGCYAIEDAPMEELFAAVRDALQGGQESIQIQIYPFRMNGLRMLSMRDHKDYKFWRELKAGWDWFEDNHQPIPIIVVDKHYRIAN